MNEGWEGKGEKGFFLSQMANLMVRSNILSKYGENYLKRYFQIAELIAEFSVCLLRYGE